MLPKRAPCPNFWTSRPCTRSRPPGPRIIRRRRAPSSRNVRRCSRDADTWYCSKPAQRGPERIGALRRDDAAQAALPVGFVAELIAPRPQPARVVMQVVLACVAHRAVHLMRDFGTLAP